jgi:phosphopantothenoylcysteine synthetase/decarboxylase
MRLLVTAGSTQTPIDQVRCITTPFSGRTGTGIALRARDRGHFVTLLTSHPAVVSELAGQPSAGPWTVLVYQTFDDLAALMEQEIRGAGLDAVIHCAAVSDYRSAGVYAPGPGSRLEADGAWSAGATLVDRSAGKIKSDEAELWLRLERTPKLIDRVRADWGFRGVLVKFKLEVGLGDDELLAIAERSRLQSAANLMVANTLEGAATWAYLGPLADGYRRVDRRALADQLLDAAEAVHGEAGHG